MAMGYVFAKVSDLNLRLPKSGFYVFVKATGAPLGAFNNEHRDRTGLFSMVQDSEKNCCASTAAALLPLTTAGSNQTCCRRLRAGWVRAFHQFPRSQSF